MLFFRSFGNCQVILFLNLTIVILRRLFRLFKHLAHPIKYQLNQL